MVLREQRVNRVDIEGVAITDSWKTYVFRTTVDEYLALILLILLLAPGKARFCMS
jgi:hypothetical protein